MDQPMVRVKVWDPWVRLFHWSIMVLLVVSYVTAKTGRMGWHMLSGYSILTLLIFRLAWGLVGSESARFRNFLRSPLVAFRHLRGIRRSNPDTELGHNAAGGWMALVLILLLLAQAITGLFADDEELYRGPFADWVGFDASQRITGWHQRIFNTILAAIALHVSAIAAYCLVLRRNLLGPMITGVMLVPAGSHPAATPPRMARPAFGAALLVAAAGLVGALWAYGQP